MLYAERHGKLGRDGSPHERSEDLLTSTAFQLLGYIDPKPGLFAALRRMRPAGTSSFPERLRRALDLAENYTLQFWPRWTGRGEPDVVVSLVANGQAFAHFVIEIKLDSDKSPRAEDALPEDATAPKLRDQLADYYRGLRERYSDAGIGVVYLTSHAVPPVEELTESLSREGGDWLGWLSWREVWSVMREAGNHSAPAADLAEILAKKGLKDFDGFEMDPSPRLGSITFWEGEAVPNPAVGRAVIDARRFLIDVHKQCQLFLESLDSQLLDRSWAALVRGKDNVTSEVGPAFKSEQWLVKYLYRFYFPVSSVNGSKRCVGVVVQFDPPDRTDEPVCLGFAARFEAPQLTADIVGNWTGSSYPCFDAVHGRQTVTPIPRERFSGFLPKASAVLGLVLPLCSFTGTGDV